MLRRFRVTAGLSHTVLAERAGLSPKGIGGLERAIRKAPYADTLGRILDSLGLTAAERAALATAGGPDDSTHEVLGLDIWDLPGQSVPPRETTVPPATPATDRCDEGGDEVAQSVARVIPRL